MHSIWMTGDRLPFGTAGIKPVRAGIFRMPSFLSENSTASDDRLSLTAGNDRWNNDSMDGQDTKPQDGRTRDESGVPSSRLQPLAYEETPILTPIEEENGRPLLPEKKADEPKLPDPLQHPELPTPHARRTRSVVRFLGNVFFFAALFVGGVYLSVFLRSRLAVITPGISNDTPTGGSPDEPVPTDRPGPVA